LVVINLAEPLEAANLDYWLNSIKKGAPNSPIIVIGTHQEKVTKAVSGNFAESVMSQFGSLVKAVVTVSSIKDLGFDRLSEAIEIAVQDHCLVGELVSARFSTLEKLVKSESNAPLITWVEFEGLCKRVSIPPSEAESALYVLQRNGSGPFRLTEPPELAGWVCTNPSWLVDMVAKYVKFLLCGFFSFSTSFVAQTSTFPFSDFRVAKTCALMVS
jgi:hypothetical protein